jgi:hypothetical protein
MYFGAFASAGNFGAFLNTTGYAGFGFGDNDLTGPIFAWARVRVDVDATSAKITVFEWAYEDSGAPIRIADTGAVPAPATPLLTLLGLGAMGVAAYRRRREAGLKRLEAEQEGAAA